MLQHLKLQDLILIEKAEIELGEGLNIFTGETGSGKSAILSAIRLIAGERADSEWIRAGANMAVVEATFSSLDPKLRDHFDLADGPVTIRREIHRSGKSRCFIEEHLVSASDLREWMRPQLEMVDQSSSAKLATAETERKILDSYAGTTNEAALFAACFEKFSNGKKELEEIQRAQENRLKDLEWAQNNLKMIEEVNWQKEEEEELTEQHHLLTHAQELSEKLSLSVEELSQIVPALRRLAHGIETLVRLDSKLLPYAETIKTAALELDEAERGLNGYASRLESDPKRLDAVENRIRAIEAVKRRFGGSWEEVEKKKGQIGAEIDQLLTLDDKQQELTQKLKKLEEETFALAESLSMKRKKGAETFRTALLEELRPLNLESAEFEVRLDPKPLSIHGIDEIRFLFSANPGRSPLPLDECCSGGELSRLLFATKLVLAKKESIQCLVFDEIDSNVGGQTATVLGEKLSRLAKTKQIICVTHFVQVARFASHHFVVAKQERKGSMVTFVEPLDAQNREREYARMTGTF